MLQRGVMVVIATNGRGRKKHWLVGELKLNGYQFPLAYADFDFHTVDIGLSH
jgi:hypothetical protein